MGNLTDKPAILLTGSHRSGSTWVGGILDTAPELAYVQEVFHPKNKINRALWGTSFRYFYTCVSENNAGQHAPALKRATRLRPRVVGAKAFLQSPSVGRSYAIQFARMTVSRIRGKRALLKDPYALLSAEWLMLHLGLRVLILVRHPAAFAMSLRRMRWEPDFPKFLQFSGWSHSPISRFGQEFVQAASSDALTKAAVLWKGLYWVAHDLCARYPNCISVRHEDLAATPEPGFRGLFAQLGITYSSDCEALLRSSTSPDNPVEAPMGVSQLTHRNSAESAIAWKRQLSQRDVDRIRGMSEPVASWFYADGDW